MRQIYVFRKVSRMKWEVTNKNGDKIVTSEHPSRSKALLTFFAHHGGGITQFEILLPDKIKTP